MSNNNINSTEGVAALKKYKVGLFSIVGLFYCACVGGAFGVEEMIATCGPGMTILVLLLLPVIWAVPFSLGVAELGSVLPEEGGAYVWIKKTLGEFWAFIAALLGGISYYVCNAVFIVLAVGYFSYIVEISAMTAMILKVGLVVLFTIINLLGIKEVGKVSLILSIVVVIAFGAVTVVGFANWTYNPVDPFIPENIGVLENLGECLAIGVWMYCGFLSIPGLAGEVENPQLIPKALLITLPLMVLTYILPTLAGLASVGNWQLWSTDGMNEGVGFSTVLTQYIGSSMGIIFCIVALISQLAVFNSELAVGSRSFFVLADDYLFPKVFRKVSKKRGVPYVGIISFSIVTLLLIGFNFNALVLLTVIFSVVGYLFVTVALVKIRKLYPIEERKAKGLFVIPGGKPVYLYCVIVPFVFCILTLLINGTDYYLCGVVMLPILVILYILCKRICGGFYKVDPEKYPIDPRTKLAVGDVRRISVFFLLVGVMSIVGDIFLRFYERSWGEEYYYEEYGDMFLGDYYGMLNILLIYGVIMLIVSAIVYLISRKVEKKE